MSFESNELLNPLRAGMRSEASQDVRSSTAWVGTLVPHGVAGDGGGCVHRTLGLKEGSGGHSRRDVCPCQKM